MLFLIKLNDEYHRKLAKLMNLACDDVATLMKTSTLESTIEIYNNQIEESIEKTFSYNTNSY